jgi:rfaE bifunctional protein kinase chain/domain
MTPARLRRALAAMRGRRVAVVGDAMLDVFLWGDATRISPEAPVPVVLIERRSYALGGAANVAANIAALGGRPVLFAVVGDDPAGRKLRALAEAAGIEIGALPAAEGRPTTVKHRVFARGKHLLRFDHEYTAAAPPAAARALLRGLEQARGLEAVAVADYAKGAITAAVARGVAELCRERRLPWSVDPKQVHLRYPGATVLKPNLLELEALAGAGVRTEAALRRAAALVLRRQDCRHVLVTRGAHGMAIFGPEGREHWLNSGGQAVADVTGAGDTVNAALALGLAAGLDLAEAAAIANLAAGHVVSQPGTAVARAEDLLAGRR